MCIRDRLYSVLGALVSMMHVKLPGACVNQDYQPVNNMRLGPFGNSNRRLCFNVSIVNDNVPETPENFMVNVQFCPVNNLKG